jgi:hypothetical protein
MKGVWGSGCIDPRILDLGTSYRCGQLHAPAALSPGKEPSVPIGQTAGWVPEPVWKTWRREKSCPYRDSKSDPSVVQPVASHYTAAYLPRCEVKDETDVQAASISLPEISVGYQECFVRLKEYSTPSLIRLQLPRISDNPDLNMKNAVTQLSTYFKRHMTFRNAHESLVCSDKI